MTRLHRSLALVLLVFIGAGPALAADDELPPLPPLTQPASDIQIPGKFIWADLFTNEFDAARKFYATTFGWEWRWVSQHGEHRYGMLYSDGEAVAGVAYRAASKKRETYARWVHYLSVADVKAARDATLKRGGRVLLERRSIADRGDFAVMADTEGAPFGLLHSSSGDPPDYRAEIGEWLWIGMYSRDADAAAKFYAKLFGYEIHEPEIVEEVMEFILASDDHSRAGIGQLRSSKADPTWLGFVRVDDMGATLERARSAGAEVLFEPEEVEDEEQLAIVGDPFGGVIGLMTWTFEDDAPQSAEASQ